MVSMSASLDQLLIAGSWRVDSVVSFHSAASLDLSCRLHRCPVWDPAGCMQQSTLPARGGVRAAVLQAARGRGRCCWATCLGQPWSRRLCLHLSARIHRWGQGPGNDSVAFYALCCGAEGPPCGEDKGVFDSQIAPQFPRKMNCSPSYRREAILEIELHLTSLPFKSKFSEFLCYLIIMLNVICQIAKESCVLVVTLETNT